MLNAQNLKKFDPFDRVILSTKGIDNSILTSLRTLAKLNNSISDTFKVIHTKFAPALTNNPNYAHRKEIPQVEKGYSVHPPLDLSVLADNNQTRSFSMGPPLKRVYKQMVQQNDTSLDLPHIEQNKTKRGFIGGFKRATNAPSHSFINEVDESQFTLTGRAEFDITDMHNQEFDTALNSTTLSTVPRRTKINEGRGGGFKVQVKDKKKSTDDTKVNKQYQSKPVDNTTKLTKGDYAHLLSEIGIRNEPPTSKMQHKKSHSVIPNPRVTNPGNVLQGNKNTVRGLIDQMYQREKKYIKQYFKEDYIQQNDFIFNLGKTHKLKLAKNKDEALDYATPPATYKPRIGEKRVMLVNGFNV